MMTTTKYYWTLLVSLLMIFGCISGLLRVQVYATYLLHILYKLILYKIYDLKYCFSHQ